MRIINNQELSFTIANLLTIPSMENSQLIAGKSGIENEITGIMVMEATDIEAWLAEGQALLSSLFPVIDFTPEEMFELIRKMSIHKASGLIVKTDRFFAEIPKSIIEGCELFGIPLIQISKETKYTEIQIEVMQILFNEKVLLLDRYYEIHQQFLEISLAQPSILTVLEVLEQLLSNPVSLLDHDYLLVETTNKEQQQSLETSPTITVEKKYMKSTYLEKTITSAHKLTNKHLIFTIQTVGNNPHYLVVHEKDRLVSTIDFVAIENAVNYLQMELIKNFAISEVKQNYHNDLIDDLMSGKLAFEDSLEEALTYLKLSKNNHYRFVVVQLNERLRNNEINSTQKAIRKVKQREFVQRFIFYWQDVIYRIRSNRIVFIMKDNGQSIEEFKTKIQESLVYILQEKKDPYPFYDFYRVGISDSGKIEDFPRISLQALKIVQLGSLYLKRNFVMGYTDLGFYKVLGDISDKSELHNLVPTNLIAFNQSHPDLINSLRVYLDTNQQYKKSAEILFIHPKSMKYRVEKIKELLQIDLEDPEIVLQYAFGLRILSFLSMNLPE